MPRFSLRSGAGPRASFSRGRRTGAAIERLEGRVLLSSYIVTDTLDSGPGSLRADILMSNSTAGQNTITFAPGLTGTITLTSGQLEISSNLSITGPGSASLTISGSNQSRVFQIDAGANAFISALTITEGRAPDATRGPSPDGGGIYNLGTLALSDDIVTGNTAGAGLPAVPNFSGGGMGGNGGGIYSSGSLTIRMCAIDSNTSGMGGPGANGFEPAPPGNGGNGGGIFCAAAVILDSSISGNHTGVGGASVSPFQFGGSGAGGGIVTVGNTNLVNCTISGNSGGGIVAYDSVHLTQDTISGNQGGQPTGLLVQGNSLPLLNNTIIAPDAVQGPLDPAGMNNLIGDGSAMTGLTTANGNRIGTAAVPLDPQLAALGAYGGPTKTMPPLPGSPAIDAGANALAIGPDGQPLATDQRGRPRIVDATRTGTARVDIGAVEVAPLPASPLVVNTVADEYDGRYYTANHLSLREAVMIANSVRAPYVIDFTPGLSGTIALSGYPPTTFGHALELTGTSGMVTVAGPGAGAITISSGSYADRAFVVDPGAQAEIDDLRITGGDSGYGPQGGGVTNMGKLTLANDVLDSNTTEFDGSNGAGIENAGTLTLLDCTVSNNKVAAGETTPTSGTGGGIDNTGTLTIIGSTISGNSGISAGGGIYNASGAKLVIANSTIAGNEVKQGDGGGIANAGTLSLINSTVSDNTSFNGSGGGLALSGGLASIYNTIVGGNHNLVRADIAGNLDYNYATKKTQYTRGAPSSNNLISDGSGNLPFDMSGNPANGNLLGTQFTPLDPRLAPLGNYGGPTQTMALRTGSPAIDAGSNALAVGPDGKPLVTDQRGYYRIFNGTVDIGAYEFGSSPLLPGDADADGKVDFADLVLVARHYGMSNATWADGDFNGDGSVGFDDLLIVARNYGRSVSLGAAVSPALVSGTASFTGVGTDALAGFGQMHRRMRGSIVHHRA